MKRTFLLLTTVLQFSAIAQARVICEAECSEKTDSKLSTNVFSDLSDFRRECDARGGRSGASGGSYYTCEWTERSSHQVRNPSAWNDENQAREELKRFCRSDLYSKQIEPNQSRRTFRGLNHVSCRPAEDDLQMVEVISYSFCS